MRRPYLFTPGPVQVPSAVALAGARELLNHRGSAFARLLKEIDAKLKQLLRTRNTILYFTASGTGAMEACVVNLLSPGDEAIVIDGGKFGQRWAQLCEAFGVCPRVLKLEWGSAPEPERISEAIRQFPTARLLFTQLFETSTAVAYDIQSIARIAAQHDVVSVVDAISGLGAVPLETDAWGVDVVIGASQKALMTPPGLSFVSVSERAWHRVEAARLPKHYWDFRAAREELFFTPFTPAISLLEQLNESLNLIMAEGVDALLRRTERYARATRRAAAAMGLKVFGCAPGAVCTAIEFPPPIKAENAAKQLESEFGIKVAGGQDQLRDRIIRIGHVGALTAKELLGALGALEIVLHRMGHNVSLGAGVRAALEELSAGEAV